MIPYNKKKVFVEKCLFVKGLSLWLFLVCISLFNLGCAERKNFGHNKFDFKADINDEPKILKAKFNYQVSGNFGSCSKFLVLTKREHLQLIEKILVGALSSLERLGDDPKEAFTRKTFHCGYIRTQRGYYKLFTFSNSDRRQLVGLCSKKGSYFFNVEDLNNKINEIIKKFECENEVQLDRMLENEERRLRYLE